MRFLKITLRLLFLFVFIAIISKIWIIYSGSFRLDKIDSKHFFSNHFEVDIKENKDLDEILNKKYKFLTKGRQSFVFESEDEKYVLKLFRFHRYRPSIFYNLISSFNFAKRYIKKIQDEKNDLYYQTMNSYKLAYEHLKDETATIYVHLNKSDNLNNKLKIEDRFKNTHFINLNEVGFVVQKKAFSFEKALLKAKNDKKAFEVLLNSFFNNLQSIYDKNLLNKDRHVIQNLGVVDENKVIELDIGRFVLKKDFDEKKVRKEVYHYTKYLKKWLLKNAPDFIKILDENLVKLIFNTKTKRT